MKKLIIATGLLMATSAYAQTEVLTGVTRGKDYGVVYALPKTQIEIEIKANKVNYKPGEFSKYADRYLRLTNVSAEPEEYWELNSVKVKPVGVPNSEATYFVKLKDKTVAPLMELTEEGLIKSINVPYSSNNAKNAANNAVAPQRKANPRDFLTEEILMASSTAKMAELVAKEIYNIRESKNALLRGQADNMPSDGAQLKIMLDNLNLQEEALLKANRKYFEDFGFEIEPFGGKEYCINAVPSNLYGLTEEELFLEMLDNLASEKDKDPLGIFASRLATMACKAAVKGNHQMSDREANALIDELLTLENPYHCPHGRPTIISMTKTELEKKFKRVL